MIHRDDAVRINSEVREFYKSGKKSGNKIYVNNVPSNQYIPADDSSIEKIYEQSFDSCYQTWSTTMAAQKARRRNQNAPSSLGNRPQVTDDCYYDFGKRIYNGGKRSEFASGNCMEMAAVSAATPSMNIILPWSGCISFCLNSRVTMPSACSAYGSRLGLHHLT